MKKIKTTKTNIMKNYEYVISVPYCQLQSLLSDIAPQSYTCGVDGWNADVYQVAPNTVIVTGYCPFGNVKPYFRLNERYEKLANQVFIDSDEYEIWEAKIRELVNQYVQEVLESKG